MMDEWELLNTEEGLALQDAMYGLIKESEPHDTFKISVKYCVGNESMDQCNYIVRPSK